MSPNSEKGGLQKFKIHLPQFFMEVMSCPGMVDDQRSKTHMDVLGVSDQYFPRGYLHLSNIQGERLQAEISRSDLAYA